MYPQMTTNQLHTEDAWCAAAPAMKGARVLACSPVRVTKASNGAPHKQQSGTRSCAKYGAKQIK